MKAEREAEAVYCAVKRLRECLHRVKFAIVTDYEAIWFPYRPTQALAKPSAVAVHRWSIALSTCDYITIHQSVKSIQHADFLSRNAQSSVPSQMMDCILLQTLLIQLEDAIQGIFTCLGLVISALCYGWSGNEKQRFPGSFAWWENPSVTTGGLLSQWPCSTFCDFAACHTSRLTFRILGS